MTEEIKHKKRKFLFNPLKRPLPYIGLIIAFVLIIFQQTIRNYVSDTIGDILINSMKEATGGVYKTTYDLVRFDIISKELRISNLQIELDTTVISKEDYLLSRPNLLHINTPLIVVKLRSLAPLLFNNQLYVSYVGAIKPQFGLVKSLHQSAAKEPSKANKKDIRNAINTYFAALEVDSFRVEKGSFKISTHSESEEELSVIHIGEFTTMLKNFRLDSLSPSILLKGMRAQSFDLEIIDQEVNLPEINQTIHFNKLSLSTNDSTFVLDSLKVVNIIENESRDISDLSINKLQILGFNFDNAFSNNELSINEIRLNEPNLIFKKNDFTSKKKSNTSASSNSLFEYFNQLKVNRVNIFNGSLDYEAEHKSKIDNFTISISDYSINPADWKDKKAISDFKLLLFSASGIEQELPDSIHIAKIDQIIYTGLNNKAVVHKLSLKPISGRNTYKSLKYRNTNFSTYSNIKAITLTHFYPEKLVINNELDIDSIIINKPHSSILQYPGIRLTETKSNTKNSDFKFSINHLVTNNGSLKLRQFKNSVSKQTLLEGIYFKSSSITESLLNKELPKDYRLLVSNGSIELKDIGHTASFNNLSFDENLSVLIDNIAIKPDSSALPFNHINAKLENVLVEGIDIEAFQNQSVSIDTFFIGNLELTNDFTREPFVINKSPNKSALKAISIADFSIRKSNINIKQGNSIVSIIDAQVDVNNIKIDSLATPSSPLIDFSNTVLNISQFSIENPSDSTFINGNKGHYSEADSTFTVNDLHFSSAPKNLRLHLEQFKIKGFNKSKLEVDQQLQFRTIELLRPSFNYVASSSKPDSLKNSLDVNKLILKGGINKVQFDTMLIVDGKSTISLPQNKTLDITSIKGIITDNTIDTLTTIYDAINRFKGVFELQDIYLKGLQDTLTIDKLHLDTKHQFVWTDSINFSTYLPTNKLKFASPGIAIDNIDIPELLKNKLSIGKISTRNNFVLLTQTDTTQAGDTKKSIKQKMPFDIEIGDINLINTTFEYNKINQPKHLLADLNFDIELDSLLVRKGHLFDLAKHTKDARFRTYNFSFDLPDSLNTVGFDTLLVSSKEADINISNLALKARYSKYEYGNKVGHQADWKDLLVEKIKLENMDFVELIENQTFKCQKITLEEGYLDLFKDKQLPFPDRVLPMLQERIKSIKVPIKVDTIEIKSVDIFQTTLQSTGLQEGGISFISTNGLITNFTNDSLRLINNRLLKVVSTTNIMGAGNLYADFEYDMLDKDNLFFINARLGPMSAKAFNNILEATAHVSVTSGNITSLNLQATGNKTYAYGNMSFIYDDLKVETINKKTLENKGMGKVLKTFFANAFVVKKKNSRIKLLRRRGGMYYERDVSRVSIDYAAKTALSGVVSSIGAKSNAKEIKQIAKDNKAARDLEIKQQKELEKAAKKSK